MATGNEASIEEGLLDKLKDLTLSPSMPIAWPNDKYEPDSGGYLKVQHFPVETNQIELGDNASNRIQGIFQVSVFWPKHEGVIAPKERASLVAAHFKRGTVISHDGLNIRIIKPPHVAGGLQEKRFFQIPVSIEYQVDVPNP